MQRVNYQISLTSVKLSGRIRAGFKTPNFVQITSHSTFIKISPGFRKLSAVYVLDMKVAVRPSTGACSRLHWNSNYTYCVRFYLAHVTLLVIFDVDLMLFCFIIYNNE